MSPLHSSARIRIYLSDFEKGKTKMIEIIDNKIYVDGKAYAAISTVDGAEDEFEKIEEGAWKWHRHTAAPTDNMRM